MSEVSQGPGWWLAPDGKWYAPEQAAGSAAPVGGPDTSYIPGRIDPSTAPSVGAVPPSAPPFYGPPPGSGGFGPPPIAPGYAPPANPAYAYPPTGAYGYPPVNRTNGLAIASLVCSFFFWLYGLGAVLAIVFGFIARSQIKKSDGTQQGSGLALAGIIIGFTGIAIGIGLIIVLAVVVHHCDQTGNCTLNTTGN